MAFRVTPSLGPDSEQQGPMYYSAGLSNTSFQLGSKHWDSNGRERMWVLNGATPIAANTQITVNATTFAAAAGSGGWYTVDAVPANAYFHAVKGTAP